MDKKLVVLEVLKSGQNLLIRNRLDQVIIGPCHRGIIFGVLIHIFVDLNITVLHELSIHPQVSVMNRLIRVVIMMKQVLKMAEMSINIGCEIKHLLPVISGAN